MDTVALVLWSSKQIFGNECNGLIVSTSTRLSECNIYRIVAHYFVSAEHHSLEVSNKCINSTILNSGRLLSMYRILVSNFVSKTVNRTCMYKSIMYVFSISILGQKICSVDFRFTRNSVKKMVREKEVFES
jgi:hypothetical protein